MKREGIIKRTNDDELTDEYGSLRYELTKHTKKYLFTNQNFYMLIHPKINYSLLVAKIKDNIRILPEIKPTNDNMNIKYYEIGYNEEIYSKNELLAFIFASIDDNWTIIEGIEKNTNEKHFWLKCDDVIYDPSLSIVTFDELYSKYYETSSEIENEDILNYLKRNNNLYKFYEKNNYFFVNKVPFNFSINFINKIKKDFDLKVKEQYTLTKEKEEHIKKYFMIDDFTELRQVLSKQRRCILECGCIATHPSIDKSILKKIEKSANSIYDLMREKYGKHINYYYGTIGNCYALSIMLNLFDEDFKLIQGYIPYDDKREFIPSDNANYLHSWLEINDMVYDPALKVITPKELYYKFVRKTDEYTKEETENMLRRIGFNLTHFRAFLNGATFSSDQRITSMFRREKTDSKEMKEEGEKLIRLVKEKRIRE